ncbi:MAG: permease-like cell division protein FtsX [Halioglobus sp.]
MSARGARRIDAPGKTRDKGGASVSRTAFADRYRGWVRHHRLSAAESLHRVLDRPLASMLTWLVIGIALALPVGFSVGLDNVTRLSANWEGSAQISLFLSEGVNDAAARELASDLQARDDVSAATYLGKQEALAEFSELSGFADILANLDSNPLPNLVLVTPVTDAQGSAVTDLREDLAARDEVAEAVLDMEWLQRLNNFMLLGKRMTWVAGAMLVLGVLLILGNTIRLAIESRRDEIVIVKLVGGSNAFVRRPFLYTGLWYGVGGGAMAALLVAVSLWLLRAPVGNLALLYESAFQLHGLGVMGSLNLVLIGGGLGLAGAWLAVGQHLSRIEPR